MDASIPHDLKILVSTEIEIWTPEIFEKIDQQICAELSVKNEFVCEPLGAFVWEIEHSPEEGTKPNSFHIEQFLKKISLRFQNIEFKAIRFSTELGYAVQLWFNGTVKYGDIEFVFDKEFEEPYI